MYTLCFRKMFFTGQTKKGLQNSTYSAILFLYLLTSQQKNLIITIAFLPVFPAALADTLVSFLPAHLPYSMLVYSS